MLFALRSSSLLAIGNWCKSCGCGNDIYGYAHLPLCSVGMDMASKPDETAVVVSSCSTWCAACAEKLLNECQELAFAVAGIQDNNTAMKAADLNTVGPTSRYRDCVDCHQSFRHRNEMDWRCAVCRGKESQRQHEQERGEALNVANGKFK